MSLRIHVLSGLIAILAAVARADFSPAKLALIDRPFLGEQMALSGDGHYLAYTVQGDGRLTLYVADIERKATKAIPLTIGQRSNRAFSRLIALRWVPGNRLILQNADGEIVAIDPDGRNFVLLGHNGGRRFCDRCNQGQGQRNGQLW